MKLNCSNLCISKDNKVFCVADTNYMNRKVRDVHCQECTKYEPSRVKALLNSELIREADELRAKLEADEQRKLEEENKKNAKTSED